ncbi:MULTISPECIES: LysE/ArgO family amino acid transporter [unclassified Lacticaseibacillus]|uniref:LysE/ArgO family amino acid transporter n=1 Tax=unclassified Lacticaseibacillus TaxID=2759744 RepID=UPI001940586B|nr:MULTISPECIES: LysE family transporter [unclassified Lacticaseibacillus]
MLAVYLRAFVIALALVSSIGMQNIFAFNNALSNPLKKALIVLGFIWLFDTLLSTVAFLGFGSLLASNEVLRIGVMGIGGVVVIWTGWGILRGANAAAFGNSQQEQSLRQWFTGAFVVSFGNPQALIDTGVTLGALRAPLTGEQAVVFLGGIVSASAVWFTVITLALNLLKDRLPRRLIMWINIVSGIIVMGYGVNLVFQAAQAILKAV